MNKKTGIIILGVLFLLIIGLIFWIYLNNTADNSNQVVVNSVASTTETTNLPVVTKPSTNLPITPIENLPSQEETGIIDSFIWVRIVFFNENDASKRLQSYFDRTGIDQKMILDKCDIAHDKYCLSDFKTVAKICKLPDDGLSSLPFAFDRSKNICYTTYADIVDYLNKELDEINRRKQ